MRFESMKGGDNDMMDVLISIFSSCIHAAIQMTYIVLESKVVKSQSINEYILVCMNGRLNWVPFLEKIS